MRTLGYLGPRGTFSHAAALYHAEACGFRPACCTSLGAVFEMVESGRLDAGIVPVENSTGGSVGETLDLLSVTEGVYVMGEMLLKVQQHLLARPGVLPHQIEKVYSHPQALTQSRQFLNEKLPGVPVVESVSTAAAAVIVSASSAPLAAIGPGSAAETYGLNVLCNSIESNPDNTTRFMIIGRERPAFTGSAKTSLVLAVKDRPGALSSILREFSLREINLTRIESRPAGKRLGDYIFFIDLVGRSDDPMIKKAVSKIHKNTLWIKHLGSYPDAIGRGEAEQVENSAGSALTSLRSKIDLVDNEILYLLGMRQNLIDSVAVLKKSGNQVIDRSREEEIIHRVIKLARENNLDTEMIVKIYRMVLGESVRRQKKLVTACK